MSPIVLLKQNIQKKLFTSQMITFLEAYDISVQYVALKPKICRLCIILNFKPEDNLNIN